MKIYRARVSVSAALTWWSELDPLTFREDPRVLGSMRVMRALTAAEVGSAVTESARGCPRTKAVKSVRQAEGRPSRREKKRQLAVRAGRGMRRKAAA